VNWIPAFAFAAVTFDIWAVTSKLRDRNLRLRLDGTFVKDEWILVWVFFFLHLIFYLFSVAVWLRPSKMSPSIIALRMLALFCVVAGAFVPIMLLRSPRREA
jgi:hypothetical protein